jgi:FKBP-type peptidyl-prolyl cis-trans isomerase
MIRHRRILLLVVAIGVVGACQSGGGAPADAGTSTPFAPHLGVDLSQMTPTGGVHYRDLAVGEGTEARSGRAVAVYYTGWLADGTPFDSTRPPQSPIRFTLGQGTVIRGWDRGMPGMRVGGRRQLVVPPSLGYGNQGVPGVPPRSTLVFDVHLVEVR